MVTRGLNSWGAPQLTEILDFYGGQLRLQVTGTKIKLASLDLLSDCCGLKIEYDYFPETYLCRGCEGVGTFNGKTSTTPFKSDWVSNELDDSLPVVVKELVAWASPSSSYENFIEAAEWVERIWVAFESMFAHEW